MKSAAAFIARHKLFFIIAGLVLSAAIIWITVSTRVPRVDLDEVSYITVSIVNLNGLERNIVVEDRAFFQTTENLERALRKKARSNRFLKCLAWSVTSEYHYKDQSAAQRNCSGNLNSDEASRLVREFLDACPQ